MRTPVCLAEQTERGQGELPVPPAMHTTMKCPPASHFPAAQSRAGREGQALSKPEDSPNLQLLSRGSDPSELPGNQALPTAPQTWAACQPA